MPSSQTPKYLFVAGVFRSGTSMLYASLNQHPAIALMYEPELQSHDLPQRLFLRKKWLENANAWGKFLYRHGFPAYPKDAAENFHCPEDLYEAYANHKQAIYRGQKSPTLHAYLPQLVKRFPDAKIITISRNPAAVF
ncbi:MAG: sulfotransferase family protein, partial [Spartobacteria bacterium]